jgi:hypothetical protein
MISSLCIPDEISAPKKITVHRHAGSSFFTPQPVAECPVFSGMARFLAQTLARMIHFMHPHYRKSNGSF